MAVMDAGERDRDPGIEGDHELRVYSDITQLIANPSNPTPLVKLNRVNPNEGFRIYLKLERFNPFGSIKDRIAIEMLSALDIGDRTVVEPSSVLASTRASERAVIHECEYLRPST